MRKLFLLGLITAILLTATPASAELFGMFSGELYAITQDEYVLHRKDQSFYRISKAAVSKKMEELLSRSSGKTVTIRAALSSARYVAAEPQSTHIPRVRPRQAD